MNVYFFNELPIEIKIQILNFLDTKSLSFFGKTNINNFQLVADLLTPWQSKLNIKLAAKNCTLFLYTPDELYVVGDNFYGRLGLGHEQQVTTFQQVKNLTGKIQEVFIGNNFSYVLTTDGLFGCGKNQSGQLGLGDITHCNTFIKIPHLEGKILQVVQGFDYTFVLTDKALYGSGNNSQGELGLGNRKCLTTFEKIDVPGKIKQVVATLSSSFVLTDKGLFVSGDNIHGQLGFGDKDTRWGFTQVEDVPADILDIIADYESTFLITDEGLYACGNNEYEKLGIGPGESHPTFTKVDLVKDKVTQVLLLDKATLILADQTLYSFGSNFLHYGFNKKLVTRLNPSETNYPFPRYLAISLGKAYETIHAGLGHFLIATKDSLLGCGEGSELGLGKEVTLTEFTDIKNLFPGDIQQVIARGSTTMVFTDKWIYGCGVNVYGMSGFEDNEWAEKVIKLENLPKSIQQGFKDYQIIQSFLAKASRLRFTNAYVKDTLEINRNENYAAKF